MNRKNFRRLIKETLEPIGLWSESAEELLMGIAAQESHLGEWVWQWNDGPARGMFQQEKLSHDEIFTFTLPNREELRNKIMEACLFVSKPSHDVLTWHTRWSIIAARVHFLRFDELLPEPNDILGLAAYWKKYWNTTEGHGTTAQFINNYEKLVNSEW